VCHNLHLDPIFYHALFDIDQEISNQVRTQGCLFCGGPLHVSNYERSPRGVLVNLSEPQLKYEYSFRVTIQGC